MIRADRNTSRLAVLDRFALALLRHGCGFGSMAELDIPDRALWRPLVRRAEFHGLVPQLASALLELRETTAVPDDVQRDVERRHTARAQSHLAGLATLLEINAAARRAGVDYLALKGPALAVALFGNRPGRSYEDVDIFVRPDDRRRARALLERRGYELASGRVLTPWLERVHFHLVFEPPSGQRLKIELHWSLLDRANLLRIDEEELFASRRSLDVAPGARVPVLAPDAELLYLCLHAAKHGVLNGWALRRDAAAEWFCTPHSGNRLKWYLDIHLFLERFGDSLDWRRARHRLRSWNAADEIRDSLRVLDRLVPDGRAARAARRLGLTRDEGGTRPLLSAPSPGQAGLASRFLLGSLRPNRQLTVRPVRVLLAWRLLFPAPAKLRRYYAGHSRLPLPLLYLKHPLHVVRKVLG